MVCIAIETSSKIYFQKYKKHKLKRDNIMNNAALSLDLMIKTQLETCAMQNEKILSALEEVDRTKFVPTKFSNAAYIDGDIPLCNERSLMAVLPFTQLIEASEVKPTDNVMIVGCNLGYSSAVMAQLANHITAVENHPELVSKARKNLCGINKKIEVVTSPLTVGCQTHAPYDVIIVEGAVEIIPDNLQKQLAEGGRLVTIQSISKRAGTNHCMGKILTIRKQGDKYIKQLGNDISGTILSGLRKKQNSLCKLIFNLKYFINIHKILFSSNN